VIKATCHLVSKSPLSMGRFIDVPKLERESSADMEERTWRERIHANEKDVVFLPPMYFKNSLSEAAKYLGMQIPGKGKSNFTKHFEAGVMCVDPLVLGVKKKDVPGEWLFVPSDGKRGGTTRVKKCFPKIDSWEGDVVFYILDEIITKPVFEKHLAVCGNFIGLGRFRPRQNGYYGRFGVSSVKWEEVKE
jgi:hypothetical protein